MHEKWFHEINVRHRIEEHEHHCYCVSGANLRNQRTTGFDLSIKKPPLHQERMSFRTLIVWCMLFLVPVQSFAGAGVFSCDPLNGAWQAAPADQQLLQHNHRARQIVSAVARSSATGKAPGTYATGGAPQNTGPVLLSGARQLEHEHHAHHAHKSPCCDGTPPVSPALLVIAGAHIDSVPVQRTFATLTSVVLEGTKRPPRLQAS